MAQNPPLNRAFELASHRWVTPCVTFASGHDPRSNDNAVLSLIYGGLEHAAVNDWQNAGRRLIDKTYVDILWHVQSLTAMRACSAESIAASLDGFIRDRIRPDWNNMADLDQAAKTVLSIRWVDEMAQRCFGSLRSEAAASRLLFFLCPTLPVFNLSRGHLLALEQLGHTVAGHSYVDYAMRASAAMQAITKPFDQYPLPTAHFGDTSQQSLIQDMLDHSDWWQRRVFDAYLKQVVDQAGGSRELFACDSAGGLCG